MCVRVRVCVVWGGWGGFVRIPAAHYPMSLDSTCHFSFHLSRHDCTSPSQGVVGDMKDLGITESFRVKSQVVASASEAAEMILRVDDILKSAPRQRTR